MAGKNYRLTIVTRHKMHARSVKVTAVNPDHFYMINNKNLPDPKISPSADNQKFFGLRLILNVLVISMFAGTVFICIYATYSHLRTSKIRDSLAILYLELEKKTEIFQEHSMKHAAAVQKRMPESLINGKVDAKTSAVTFNGNQFPLLKSISDLGYANASTIRNVTYLRNGSNFSILYRKEVKNSSGEKDGNIAIEAEIVSNLNFLNMASLKETTAVVYVANRSGELMFANKPAINPQTVSKRELVQRFIALSITKGQISYSIEKSGKHYGFFNEIKGTNLVVFAELPEAIILQEIHESTASIFVKLSLASLISVIFLQLVIYFLLRPFKGLIRHTKAIATGDFSQNISASGAGEFVMLANNMNYMTDNLRRRDETIQALVKEQNIKVTLDNELNIARNIQEKFLPSSTAETMSDLKIGSFYKPSGHVAGDWYNIHHSEEHGLVVIAIVDISGHGAGASMFTAIAASIFESYIFDQLYLDHPETFFRDLNRKLLKYGKKDWHATAQLMIYSHINQKTEVYNAGHVPPLFIRKGKVVPFKIAGGNPLGFDEKLDLARAAFTLDPNDILFLCTDGILEARNHKGNIFGRKRIAATLAAAPPDPQRACLALVQEAMQFQDSDHFSDDVCLITVRRRA